MPSWTSGRLLLSALGCATALTLWGCEGYDRTKPAPVDTTEDAKTVRQRNRTDGSNPADELERMMELRQQYLDHLTRLEKMYLENGDMARASWARRQRDETAGVTVYPFASDKAPEQSSRVRPEQSIPEADALYEEGLAQVNSFHGIALAGVLDANKDKARKAVRVWKELLRRYPTSDKVDDAAYWIGECYKEYLREEDPDNQLALRYFQWAIDLDPQTPHPARFRSAVVYDYRMHDRRRAIEYYRKVLDDDEQGHWTNEPFARKRINQLTDEEKSKFRPRETPARSYAQRPQASDPLAEPTAADESFTSESPADAAR